MKKFVVAMMVMLFGMTAGMNVWGQEAEEAGLKVLSFEMQEMDLDARVNEPVEDINGKVCAIIKVETTKQGFSFDTGTITISKTVQKKGEIWVYVSPGIRKLSIFHQDYTPLRDYELPCAIAPATVYVLRLATPSTQVPETDAVKLEKEPEVRDANITSEPEGVKTFTVNGVSFNMVYVEGGTFTMGATAEQGADASDDEKPAHSVTLSSYSIGQTEVTQELWKAVMGEKPSYFKGSKNPVEIVSYEDCLTFISKLNSLTGQNFRLPTEAEWEYAARGGKYSKGYKYSGSNNIDNVAWYTNNSGSKTHPVATKQANELGLYDMTGNVWEWCSDWYDKYKKSSQTNPQGPRSGSFRVIRGGSWFDSARYCRVSYRFNSLPDGGDGFLGVRLVLP